MDHNIVLKDIKQKKFEKVYFLHGEESYYIDVITQSLLDHVLEEHERDFNQTIVYGKEQDVTSLVADLRSYPMMSDRRLVVLREAQEMKDIDKLESYFENPTDTTIFVVNYKHKTFDSRKKLIKLAASNGLVYKSDKVRDYQMTDWIRSYVKTHGYEISSKATMLLVEFLGTDIGKVANELDKLSLLIQKGTTINEVHIEENIGISKDYNIFELTNSLGIYDVPKAFRIVKYFEHNPKAAPLVMVVPTLFKFFSQLMRIHFLQNKSKEAIASALKVHPFVAGELLSSSKIYNPKKIAANMQILHEYDLKSKGVGTAGTNESELMKEMIYRLMH
jgi:DNA polymerase-3 subunit delta